MADFTEEEYEEISGEVKSSLPEDVTGQYPDPGFFFKENTNKEALGEQRNNLVFAGTAEKVKYTSNKPPVSSIPGLNQVSESLTGHVYEVDDTPGNERILIKHKDGAGIELKPDGSICISALNNRVEVTGGNQSITIVGDAQLTYQGNLDMKVNGEFNIECNEFNVDVKNNKKETIGGAERKEVYKGSTNITVGDVNNFITNKETNTILGGQANNVKGNMDYNIHGNAAFYSSGGVNVTSEDFINIASDNVTASANNMTVQGGTGVIGGTGVDVVGNGAIFDKGVKAPTFHGDLNGLAAETRSQSYGEAATSGGAAITNTITPANIDDVNAANYNVPDASVVSAYTSSASGGVKKVLVDETSKLKNYLDRTEQYGGITNKAVTTPEARSMLRDPGNRDNSKFIETLLKNNIISENYNDPIPPGIGRIVDIETSAITSDKPANAVNKKTNVIFIPRNEVKQFLPDPNYSPLNTGHRGIDEDFDITAKTLLAPNISLSKFLGTDHPVNLKYIRDENKKRQIAKHLYLQTFIIKMIQENKKKFDGITLNVSEGLYRPGPTEKITPGSINDLKSKGRAVAYKAVNSIGEIEVSRMFDIASYLKDKAYYDTMILSYDTYTKKNGEPVLDVSLIITMPELDDNYTGTFTRDIFTEFNSNKLTQAELVEVLPAPLQQDIEYNLVADPTNDKHDLDPKTRPELRSILISAANEMGLTIISDYKNVPERGLRPNGRSGRHNTGLAHDIFLSTDGSYAGILEPFKRSKDLVLVKKYSRLFYNKAYQAGFKPSIGWGDNYMDGVRGHYDIAADIAKKPSGKIDDFVVQSRWGNSGRGRNAPQFLKDIYGY